MRQHVRKRMAELGLATGRLFFSCAIIAPGVSFVIVRRYLAGTLAVTRESKPRNVTCATAFEVAPWRGRPGSGRWRSSG